MKQYLKKIHLLLSILVTAHVSHFDRSALNAAAESNTAKADRHEEREGEKEHL